MKTVQNGKEAVDYFDELFKSMREQTHEQAGSYQPVTLVLLDINMPIMTGLEAIKIIKQQFLDFNSQENT